MERNDNESLKNFQVDSSQRIYNLSSSCPSCGRRIAIGYETHVQTCNTNQISENLEPIPTQKQDDYEFDTKSYPPNTPRPSALVKKLSSSVAPHYFVPPNTQHALQTVCDAFSNHFMEQLLKRKQWVTKRNTVRPEDLWATLETEDFDLLAHRMRAKNAIPKYEAPGNITDKQLHMPVDSVNEFFLEDEKKEEEEEFEINPYFLK